MAGEGPDAAAASRPHSASITRLRALGAYDPGFDAAFEAPQPRCRSCGIVMRDVPGGWRCPACAGALVAVPGVFGARRAV
ncbi:rubrerythrin [Microbacterium ulmi]|nr:rubrerythrin [Microbacterium ulmi]